ncbi:hypothetical protein [Acidithiobacillus thiooxidans]|uniref:hypothetical protein n=1 Tax=Acidithiobacillus thiooxidans TaxID=930 RepID=UPI0004E1C3FF|nr:hypothetical protein [Acidithiobacillus thiooxidans]
MNTDISNPAGTQIRPREIHSQGPDSIQLSIGGLELKATGEKGIETFETVVIIGAAMVALVGVAGLWYASKKGTKHHLISKIPTLKLNGDVTKIASVGLRRLKP